MKTLGGLMMATIGLVVAGGGAVATFGASNAASVSPAAILVMLVGCFIIWRGLTGAKEGLAEADGIGDGLKECPACMKRIPNAAKRCSFCTEDFRAPK